MQYFNKPHEVKPLLVLQQRLTILAQVHVEKEQDGKQIYFELTKIMKEYIAYRYHISVIGLTDKEIVLWAYLVIPEDKAKIVELLLSDVTSIKFEHQIATSQRIQQDIALMQDFIQKTTQEHTDRKEA